MKRFISISTLVLTAAAIGTLSLIAQQKDFNPGMFGSIPDQKEPDLTAVVSIDETQSQTINAAEYTSTNEDENVLLIKNKATADFTKSTFTKKSGDSSNMDQSNFYGLNAAVICKGNAELKLKKAEIFSDAEGANAVFCTGSSSRIYIDGIKINTLKNSSRGLDATYGGYINAENVDVTTKGAHCAAFATDRGEGTVIVKKGKASTAGDGSPIIYSTGNIQVSSLTGSATGAQIACIEGKNSIYINDSKLSGSGPDGIMLYQSMSGDANQGTSVLNVAGSTLTSDTKGPFFYITNTQAQINISKTKINYNSGILIQCSGNNSERGWGQRGANGGTLRFNSTNQTLTGNITVDSISSIDLHFGDKTIFTGSINTANEGKAKLYLSANSKLTLTANCYFDSFVAGDLNFKNIKSNGYTIYYNINNTDNNYLDNKTYMLDDGGVLKPLEMTFANTVSYTDEKKCEAQNKGPEGQMDFTSYTGTITASGSDSNAKYYLVTEDGNKYELCVMDFKKPDDKNDGKEKGKNPPSGQPPAMPPDSSKEGPHGNGGPDQNHQPPKMITIEDIVSYAGKTVTVTGILKDGKLTVIEIKQ